MNEGTLYSLNATTGAIVPLDSGRGSSRTSFAKWAGHRSVATIYSDYGHLLSDDATVGREALSTLRAAAIPAREDDTKVVPLHAARVTDGGALGARTARAERRDEAAAL